MRTLIICGIFLALACSPQVSAWPILGPEWVEQGDAGSLPQQAQPVTGEGQLTKITGHLDGAGSLAGAGDFEDMYLIRITTPSMFSLTTIGAGSANFNTQLWVFSETGNAILGNDDAFIGEGKPTGGSFLGQFATDQTEAGIFEPGFYLVCISGAGNRPTSDGLQMYNFEFPGEVSGPDGPGGEGIVNGWAPAGAIGNYSIAVTGSGFIVPTPGALGILMLGLIARRRRR